MKKLILLISIVMVSLCGSCAEKGSKVNNSPVKHFDLKRYLGKWYEIARYPNSFEKGLEGITAVYTMRDDGKVKVANSGYRDADPKRLKTAIGKAKTTERQGVLKVSFFLNFYSDYIVMELDQENYSYSVVGSSTDKYLWILSRTPTLPQETINMIFQKLADRGYDTTKLIYPKLVKGE